MIHGHSGPQSREPRTNYQRIFVQNLLRKECQLAAERIGSSFTLLISSNGLKVCALWDIDGECFEVFGETIPGVLETLTTFTYPTQETND